MVWSLLGKYDFQEPWGRKIFKFLRVWFASILGKIKLSEGPPRVTTENLLIEPAVGNWFLGCLKRNNKYESENRHLVCGEIFRLLIFLGLDNANSSVFHICPFLMEGPQWVNRLWTSRLPFCLYCHIGALIGKYWEEQLKTNNKYKRKI